MRYCVVWDFIRTHVGFMFVFCNAIRCRKRMVLDKEELEKKMNEMGLSEQEKTNLAIFCVWRR